MNNFYSFLSLSGAFILCGVSDEKPGLKNVNYFAGYMCDFKTSEVDQLFIQKTVFGCVHEIMFMN